MRGAERRSGPALTTNSGASASGPGPGPGRSPAQTQRGRSAPPSSNGGVRVGVGVGSPLLAAETVAALPPPGLSGPSGFAFSPPCGDDNEGSPSFGGRGGRYLSFLSGVGGPPAAPAASSGGGGGWMNGGGGALPALSSGERRLCVVDLEPFARGLLRAERELEKVLGAEDEGREDEEVGDGARLLAPEAVTSQSSARGVFDRRSGPPYLTTGNAAAPSSIGTDWCGILDKNPVEVILPPPSPDLPLVDPRAVARDHVRPLLFSGGSAGGRGGQNRGILSGVARRRRHHLLHRRGGSGSAPTSFAATGGSTIEAEAGEGALSLEERLRRERQRLHSSGVTQFSWGLHERRRGRRQQQRPRVQMQQKERKRGLSAPCYSSPNMAVESNVGTEATTTGLRVLVSVRGNVYVQDGVGDKTSVPPRLVYDKASLDETVRSGQGGDTGENDGIGGNKRERRRRSRGGRKGKGKKVRSGRNAIDRGGTVVGRDSGAVDPQLSPDGSMVAFVVAGEIYVTPCDPPPDGKDDDSSAAAPPGAMEVDFNSLAENRQNSGDRWGLSSAAASVFPGAPVRVTFGAMEDDDSDSDSSCTSCSSSEDFDDNRCNPSATAADNSDGTLSQTEQCDELVRSRDRRGHRARRSHRHRDGDRRRGGAVRTDGGGRGRRSKHASSSRRSSHRRHRHSHRHPRCVTHGLADFVAQEEMDRYRGYWWDPDSSGILFARVDESGVPPYRISHQGRDGTNPGSDETTYEDHRYPFAGEHNPEVWLGYVGVDRASVLGEGQIRVSGSDGGGERLIGDWSDPDGNVELSMDDDDENDDTSVDDGGDDGDGDGAADEGPTESADDAARSNWSDVRWFDPPEEASEYLARVSWLPDGAAAVQWQDRAQSTLVLTRVDLTTGRTVELLAEYSGVWINLHHMFRPLDQAIHPDECRTGHQPAPSSGRTAPTLPDGSFSFLWASERTGYSHLYLYTYVAGSDSATLVRTVSAGEWIVESIAGVDVYNDVVYITGTYDSPLERHLYALPIVGSVAPSSIQPREVSHRSPNHQPQGRPSSRRGPRSLSMGLDSSAHNDGVRGVGSTVGGGNTVRRGLKSMIHSLGGGGGGPSSRRTLLSGERITESLSSSVAAAAAPQSSFLPGPPYPLRLTSGSGMHSVVMDDACRIVIDTSSDLNRPTSSKVYALPVGGPFASYTTSVLDATLHDGDGEENMEASSDGASRQRRLLTLLFVPYDATFEEKPSATSVASRGGPLPFAAAGARGGLQANGMGGGSATATSGSGPVGGMSVRRDINYFGIPPPEILSFPSSDGAEMLYAAVYWPDPAVHGQGPYPLICSVYGGPHVQRVNRSWSQCADMRAQRLCGLGFAVVKCDNRGSARRGLAFEGAIRKRLGRLEVLDQVTAVRHLAMQGAVDPTRVGIYGWSYGGYLAAMCLCRAPDVFHVAVAGAPVTSWDGYDTHYTERYMGLPSENPGGYGESAVFDHVPNMRGRLMIVHGLIDENVHFRHTARLINRLVAAGKDYDLLIFPDERHSPRRLRDRVYMEKRISDYFIRNLLGPERNGGGSGGVLDFGENSVGVRPMVGHL